MTAFDSIIKWNKERNNVEFVGSNELEMLHEEFKELMDAYQCHIDEFLKNENHERAMIDALCDIIVVATGAIHKLGYNPNIAMSETIDEISSRKQDPIQKDIWDKWGASGKWKKWTDQPMDTLYKANYAKAKYEA